MASENETVEEIVNETKFTIDYGNGVLLDLAGKQAVGILDRIEAAHQREVGEMCGERNGILNANASLAYDNDRLRREVAELERKVSELRECLKEAVTEVCNRLEKCGFKEPCVFKTCYVQRWRKALQDERGAK